MAQTYDKIRSFTATADVDAFLRVKLTAGGASAVEVAGAGEEHIGSTLRAAKAGEQVPVVLRDGSYTVKQTAAGAFDAGAVLYGAAAGKVDDAVVGNPQSTALQASAGDGDVVEVLADNGAAGSINGGSVLNLAEAALGVPIIILKSFADAASGDTVILNANCPRKIQVLDAVFENRGANGANANTVQLCAAAAGASPITDAMSTNAKVAGDLVRAGNITLANAVIAANGSLIIARTRAGGVLTGLLRITVVPIA
jgi:hypothetical protein